MGAAVVAVRKGPESFLPCGIEEVQTVRGASHRKLLHLSFSQPRRLHRPRCARTLKSTPMVAVEDSGSNWSSQYLISTQERLVHSL